jgi:hypothetical protein
MPGSKPILGWKRLTAPNIGNSSGGTKVIEIKYSL